MKIALAVDNDKMSLEIMGELLLEHNYQMIGFTEFANALAYLQTSESPIELFLIHLPINIQTGLEMLTYLKCSADKYNMAPVIVMSTLSSRETKERALNLGAANFLIKPFDEWMLMQTIQAATR